LKDNIRDLILFGSLVKGGSPKDIDIAVIPQDDIEISETKKKIRNVVPNADIQIINVQSIYNSIWLTLIKEGYSVKRGKFISDISMSS
jgi:predicted nucleotidyltransferase